MELLRIHAPKTEDKFKKALSRVLVGLPSQLGQVLISDICDKPVKLNGCCCHKSVYTLWCIQLPLTVRSQISNMKFDHTTYSQVFQAADKIYLSTKTTDLSAGVAAIAVSPSTPKAAGQSLEVAAVRPGKPQRSGGNRGGRNANSNSNNNRNNQPRPSVPAGCCANHKKWAANAWFCLDPHKCPMATKTAPRPEKKKEDK